MNGLKGAALFILGFGMGAACSIVFIKDKYEKELNKALAELREAYSERKEHEIAKTEYEDIVRDSEYVSYETMSNKEIRKHVNEVAENVIEKDTPPEDYPKEPIEISEEEYSEHELYFEKIEVDYYLGDGALVDEADELLNIDDNIGIENVARFADDDREVFYIRNADKGIDYLVNKVEGNYSDIIGLGGDDDED